MVEHRDHGIAALAREAFLTDVLGAEVAFEGFGRSEALENMLAKLRCIRRLGVQGFEPRLDEALLRSVGDVHVLRAEAAAVGVLQRSDHVAQAHPACTRRSPFVRPDIELGIEVRVGEAVGLVVEVGDVRARSALQRVEIRLEHADRAIFVDQPQYQHLLMHGARIEHRRRELAILRQLDERIDDRGMRDVAGIAAQRVEIRPPIRVDRGWVGQVDLVLILDERSIAAEQGAALFQFLHRIHGLTCNVGTKSKPDKEFSFSVARSRLRRDAPRQCRAAAGVRSSGRDPRSSRSTGRSTLRCVPARKWQ